MTAGGPGGPARRWAAPDALVALGVLLNLAVYAALGGVPWEDMANHAARYALLERAWFGTPAPWIRVAPLPAPYLGLDAVGAVLAHLLGAAGAARVVGAAALCAPAVGLWLLLRRTAPACRAGALAGVLLGLSFFFLNGMVNYVLGVGAALAWAAAWWPRRARCTPGERAGLALGVAGLYTLHLSAAGVALLLVGADLFAAAGADVWAARGGVRPTLRPLLRTLARAHGGRLATLLACAGAVGALWLALAAVLPPTPGVPAGAPTFRPWRSKAWTVTLPFYTFGPWELAVTVPAYVAGLAGCWRAGLGRGPGAGAVWRTPLVLTVLLLDALYLVTPMATAGGVTLLDIRWLPPAALLAFAAAAGSAEDQARGAGLTVAGLPRWAAAALLAGCAGRAALVLGAGRVVARDLAEYDAVLAALPRGGRLLAVVAGPQRFARVEPRMHYAHWQTVRAGAQVGGLFSYAMHAAGRPPAAYFHLAHVRDLAPGWYLDERWDVAGRPAIPWPAVRRDYDYVVLAGADAAAWAAVRAGGGCPLARRGAVAAWSTRPCAALRAVPNTALGGTPPGLPVQPGERGDGAGR